VIEKRAKEMALKWRLSNIVENKCGGTCAVKIMQKNPA
jgi:hypothetical protein